MDKIRRFLQPVGWQAVQLISAAIAIAGALVEPLANHVIVPAFQGLKKRFGRKPAA